MKIIYRIVFLMITSLSVKIYAQENISPGVNEIDQEVIQGQVTSIFGAEYEVTCIINPDSAINNRLVADGAISNPYGTMSNCFIFVAQEQNSTLSSSHGVVGIYKNGTVFWHSATIVNNSLCVGSSISATLDLNNDGKVEIVTSWFGGVRGDVERLWIFTWDGTTGSLINAIDIKNESVLVSKASNFEYIDIDGNEVFEITGLWLENENDENLKKIVYCWNGTQYGKWASIPQPLQSGFYPRNKVDATVKATIMSLMDKFLYNYKLQNKTSSRQKINEFIFDVPPDSISNNRCMDNWIIGGVTGKGFGWILLPGFHNFLTQGKSDSSFYFECNRLPAIVQCFIRGENGSRVPMQGDSIDYNFDRWYNDVRDNSFKIVTIAPKNPPVPFIPLDFLDTLTSYTTQSRILGWIKDQPTATKYLGYFASAKTKLIQSDSVGARTILQHVLHDVDIDSTANLSSEAYALLRFNT
jgi:hypothetical protein